MPEPPAFQWYPKDCDTDENVRAMDDREFGLYMRCLNHAWLNRGLPVDTKELSRVLNRKHSYLMKLWPRISKCFTILNERRINLKQEEQRIALARHRSERSCSGRQGAEKRWNKKNEGMAQPSIKNGSAINQPLANDSSASASASAIQGEGGQEPVISELCAVQDVEVQVPEGNDFLTWFEQLFVGEWRGDTWRAVLKHVNTTELVRVFMQNTPSWMNTERYSSGHGKDSFWYVTSEIWRKPPPSAMAQKEPLEDSRYYYVGQSKTQ